MKTSIELSQSASIEKIKQPEESGVGVSEPIFCRKFERKNQSFLSKASRFNYNIKKDMTPAPGRYRQNQLVWTKASFNKLYAKS
jgi:hypothetical protein